MIQIHIESNNGHDTLEVPKEDVQEKVKEIVTKDDKWATVEHENGTTEILTKEDFKEPDERTNNTPTQDDDLDEEDKKLANSWKNTFGAATKPTTTPTKVTSSTRVTSATTKIAEKFEKVTSVTCTAKAKGG